MGANGVKMEDFTLAITMETLVKAPIEVTFASLLEQLGPYNETPEGRSLQMKIEPWPGGRWYRDLGDGNGHYWATVQAIKKPTLLEFSGPLFASYPLVSNVQYRLSEEPGGTLIKFRHTALGFIDEEHKKGATSGWTYMLQRAVERAEKARGGRVQ
jgi:uncharacterized protein YndB with AHSA1/START domain